MSERRLMSVRDCSRCPDRARGCGNGCEDLAARRILDAIALPERRAQARLRFDLNGIKRDDITRNMRKKHQSRRK